MVQGPGSFDFNHQFYTEDGGSTNLPSKHRKSLKLFDNAAIHKVNLRYILNTRTFW